MSDALTVLLVEDDRHIALALQIRLRAAGYVVMLAASVTDALASVDRHVPDAAVLDVNLPDGDGIELMQRIAQRDQAAAPLSIIMTASCKPGLREHALAKGAIAVLQKPFSSALLLEALAG